MVRDAIARGENSLTIGPGTFYVKNLHLPDSFTIS